MHFEWLQSQGVGTAAQPAAGELLTKVVLARRSDVLFRGELDPLALLATLQVQCRSRCRVAAGMPAASGPVGDSTHRHQGLCWIDIAGSQNHMTYK